MTPSSPFRSFTVGSRSLCLRFASLYPTNPTVCLDIISPNTESILLQSGYLPTSSNSSTERSFLMAGAPWARLFGISRLPVILHISLSLRRLYYCSGSQLLYLLSKTFPSRIKCCCISSPSGILNKRPLQNEEEKLKLEEDLATLWKELLIRNTLWTVHKIVVYMSKISTFAVIKLCSQQTAKKVYRRTAIMVLTRTVHPKLCLDAL